MNTILATATAVIQRRRRQFLERLPFIEHKAVYSEESAYNAKYEEKV